MNQEYMRIAFSCIDQDTLWVIDEIVYGLYAVDKKTFETKCIIDSWNLFRYGLFKPYGLIKWKEEYIVIIPQELQKRWVIYNKITGQVEYKRVMEMECRGIFIGIDDATDQAYFCPVTKKDSIVIVNMRSFICTQIIKVLETDELDSHNTMTWKGICSEKYILFPQREKSSIVRLDYKSGQVKILESNIIEGIGDVDFYLGELWVLPIDGKKIYKINEDGEKVDSIDLIMSCQNISASDFAKIIVQKNYIFLLPYNQCGIYVYNRAEKRFIKVPEENYALPDKFQTRNMSYWGYYIDNNKICFLPMQYKYLQIDLDNLHYEQKELYYPCEWKENSEAFYCIWNHAIVMNDYMLETDINSQKSFLKYIQNKDYKEKKKMDTICYGERLWTTL